MEEYGLDVLAASAEAVVAGLGPLAVQLAGLAVQAAPGLVAVRAASATDAARSARSARAGRSPPPE